MIEPCCNILHTVSVGVHGLAVFMFDRATLSMIVNRVRAFKARDVEMTAGREYAATAFK